MTGIHDISLSFVEFMSAEMAYSTVAFICVFSSGLLLRKKLPYLQYGLWLLVFVRFLLPVGLASGVSGRSVFDGMVGYGQEAARYDRGPIGTIARNLETVMEHIPSFSGSVSLLKVEGIRSTVFIFWLAGFLLVMAVYFAKMHTVQKLVAESRPVKRPEILDIVRQWRRHYGLRRRVCLVCCGDCGTPFTTGLLRPVIVMPGRLLAPAHRKTLEAVIAHEMTHIRNLDDIWIKLQNILQAVYFFNPLIWYVNHRITQARERLCDSVVLSRRLVSAPQYCTGLVDVLTIQYQGSSLARQVLFFGSEKKALMQRIRMINRGSLLKKYEAIFSAMLVVFAGILLLPMAKYETSGTGGPWWSGMLNETTWHTGMFGIALHVIGLLFFVKLVEYIISVHTRLMDAFCRDKLFNRG